MPNYFDPIQSVYNSLLSYKIGKELNKNNEKDKLNILGHDFSKTGLFYGGLSTLGGIASANEANQRQDIVNEIRQNSRDSDYINVPTDSNRYNFGVQDRFNPSSFQKGGEVDRLGYKRNSPYIDESYLDIESPRITMKNVDFPVLGVSNNGVSQVMLPNGEYMFRGAKTVREFPLKMWDLQKKYEDGGELNGVDENGFESWQNGYEGKDNTSIEDHLRDNPNDYQAIEFYTSLFNEEPEMTIDPQVEEMLNWQREASRNMNNLEEQRIQVVSNQGGSIAERHNNPGNIKFGKFAQKYGATQGEYSQREKDGTYYSSFPTIEQGLAAQRGLLQSDNYRNLTVPQALNKWADGTYTNQKFINMFGNKKIKDLSDTELRELQREQIRNEDANMFRKIYK